MSYFFFLTLSLTFSPFDCDTCSYLHSNCVPCLYITKPSGKLGGGTVLKKRPQKWGILNFKICEE